MCLQSQVFKIKHIMTVGIGVTVAHPEAKNTLINNKKTTDPLNKLEYF